MCGILGVVWMDSLAAAMQALEDAERACDDARAQVRATALAAHEDGIPIAQIARGVGRSRQQVHDWIDRAKRERDGR